MEIDCRDVWYWFPTGHGLCRCYQLLCLRAKEKPQGVNPGAVQHSDDDSLRCKYTK